MRVLLLLLAPMLAACARAPSPPGSVVLRGKLVDAETGEPVSRGAVYIHAFDDATKRQVSLSPDADEDSFELTAPAATVRLRIADTSKRYELNEQTFTVSGGAWNGTVRMVPTHFVRLHGRVLWRDGDKLRPPSEGDGRVRHAGVSFGPGGGVSYDEDGSFSARLPRKSLKILLINTSLSPAQDSLDLSAFTGDEQDFDIILE